MKLEEEAKKMLKEKEKIGYSYEYYDGFIDGANSNWVNIKTIKSNIDILEKVKVGFNAVIEIEIYNLKQKLKQIL
jgi:hypothetical protein